MQSLRILSVLCVSAVFGMDETVNRGDAEDAEYAQRKNLMGLLELGSDFCKILLSLSDI
jgi:hypothetical protein